MGDTWSAFKLPQEVSSFLMKALHDLRRRIIVNFSVLRYGIIGML